MIDQRLRTSLSRVLDEYMPDINYIEESDRFVIQHGPKVYHYFPEEGEWCNAKIRDPKYYPCKSIRKFIECYVLA